MDLDICSLEVVDVILSEYVASPDFNLDCFLQLSGYDVNVVTAWVRGRDVVICVSANMHLDPYVISSNNKRFSSTPSVNQVIRLKIEEYLQKHHPDYFHKVCLTAAEANRRFDSFIESLSGGWRQGSFT